jgi:chorismate mutase
MTDDVHDAPRDRGSRDHLPRVRALRAATTLDVDEREHLFARTQELMDALFVRNGLVEDDLISIVFTATDDVHSAYPAEAARDAGITHVPLLCARELDVDGGIARCIRLLVHAYTDRPASELRHVYLHDARQLRTDLPE